MSDRVGGSLYNGMRRRVHELRCGLSELRIIEPKCTIISYTSPASIVYFSGLETERRPQGRSTHLCSFNLAISPAQIIITVFVIAEWVEEWLCRNMKWLVLVVLLPAL